MAFSMANVATHSESLERKTMEALYSLRHLHTKRCKLRVRRQRFWAFSFGFWGLGFRF
jgi:hypothetical protein